MASQTFLFVCLFCRFLLVKKSLTTCKPTLNKEKQINNLYQQFISFKSLVIVATRISDYSWFLVYKFEYYSLNILS